MKILKTAAILFFGYLVAFLNFANASDLVSGSQVCQPMSLNQAMQGIQWRSYGIENASGIDLWVVCPTSIDWNSGFINLDYSAKNRTANPMTVQCLTKVNDDYGNQLSVQSNDIFLFANGEGDGFAGVGGVDFSNNVTLSCKLPPGASLGTINAYTGGF